MDRGTDDHASGAFADDRRILEIDDRFPFRPVYAVGAVFSQDVCFVSLCAADAVPALQRVAVHHQMCVGKEIPVLDLGFVQVVDRVDQVARRFPVYAVVRGVDARVFPSGSVRRQAVPIAVRPQRVGRFRHPVSIPVPSSGNVYHRRMVRLSVSFRRFDVQRTLVVRFESEIPIYVVDGDQ